MAWWRLTLDFEADDILSAEGVVEYLLDELSADNHDCQFMAGLEPMPEVDEDEAVVS